MNDRRRSERVAGLRLTLCDRHVSNEGYDDKLQTDQGAGRRPDDYVEVLPPGECCHAVELFLNGDVRHGRCPAGAMPMLLSRRDPDYVARPNLLDRASRSLYATGPSRYNQRLAQRMRVPCCPSAGLERDSSADHACRSGCLEQGINTYRARKVLCRSLAGSL